ITFLLPISHALRYPHSFPTRRSSDLEICTICICLWEMKKHSHFVSLYGRLRESKLADRVAQFLLPVRSTSWPILRLEMLFAYARSEEHTSELQSRFDLVCRLLLEKKK